MHHAQKGSGHMQPCRRPANGEQATVQEFCPYPGPTPFVSVSVSNTTWTDTYIPRYLRSWRLAETNSCNTSRAASNIRPRPWNPISQSLDTRIPSHFKLAGGLQIGGMAGQATPNYYSTSSRYTPTSTPPSLPSVSWFLQRPSVARRPRSTSRRQRRALARQLQNKGGWIEIYLTYMTTHKPRFLVSISSLQQFQGLGRPSPQCHRSA